MIKENGGERRQTAALGSGDSKGAGPVPVKQNDDHPAVESEKDEVIKKLLKQVDDKTIEIGQLCTEVVNFRQALADARRKLSETDFVAEETERRRANLAEALSEVQTELAQAKANAEFFGGRVKVLEGQCEAAWAEKDKLVQDLIAAKLANPESEFEKQVGEFSVEAGRLKTELDFTKKARAEAEKLIEELKAEIEKIKADAKTEIVAFETETALMGDGLKQEIVTLRQQLNETRRKYYDALAEGRGLSGEYLQQIEVLKKELAAVQVTETKRADEIIAKFRDEAKKAIKTIEDDYETKVEQLEKRLAGDADWFDKETNGNGVSRRPTEPTASVVVKSGLIARLLGLFGKKVE